MPKKFFVKKSCGQKQFLVKNHSWSKKVWSKNYQYKNFVTYNFGIFGKNFVTYNFGIFGKNFVTNNFGIFFNILFFFMEKKVLKNVWNLMMTSHNDIEIEFELTLLTYKVFSCKDVRSKFLGVRLLAVQSNTQSRSWKGHPSNHWLQILASQLLYHWATGSKCDCNGLSKILFLHFTISPSAGSLPSKFMFA